MIFVEVDDTLKELLARFRAQSAYKTFLERPQNKANGKAKAPASLEIAAHLDFPPGASLDSTGDPLQAEFWTSKEVRNRCLRIVDKIGGPAEKRRAAALFFNPSNPKEPALGMRYSSAEEAVEAYWRDSRHPQNMIRGLVPLRLFEDEVNSLQVQIASGSIITEENPF
ncbi:hypothetical protein A7U60_g2420 [Sanghuangporus baumii]|uniref:Uncharacterized protein n=1 Tax=Sanghuangporus baumii TaxID=108892 RepID=A0A9Q5NDZ4_SANBA|nr:hypothetical protein A7U60_g2420 [Sanghuangporus baumii]